MMQVMWTMKKEVRHQLSETHSVLATPEELALWIEQVSLKGADYFL